MRNRSSVAVVLVLGVLFLSVLLLPGQATAQLPVCEIETPSVDHARVHETYVISGSAHVENGTIEKVEIRIGEEPWINASGNTTWSYEWHTEEIENGEYTIYARSFDGINYSEVVNVTVDLHNPTDEEKALGDVFFWVMLVFVLVIAVGGLALEVRRRKQA
jgi:hypothetical protein